MKIYLKTLEKMQNFTGNFHFCGRFGKIRIILNRGSGSGGGAREARKFFINLIKNLNCKIAQFTNSHICSETKEYA